MKNPIGVMFYAVQLFATWGAYMMDRRIRDTLGGALSQKSKLAKEISQMTSSIENFFIVGAGWFGFCLFAIIGIITYLRYLRQPEDRCFAWTGAAFGVVICGVSIFWPLVI